MTQLALRTLFTLLFSTLLAAQVTITSASRSGDNGTVDVKARIEAEGNRVTLRKIEFLGRDGTVYLCRDMGSEWTSNTTTSWTYSGVAKKAVKVRITHSNGVSNTFTISTP
ncbi:MAG: hypothetical protein NXI31_20520 [bacterium]|nr:hypothetical protein [bacterium]